MKKFLFLLVALASTVFCANAQVKISSPHPDLDIQVKRCAYASGKVVIDMVLTNFGADQYFDARSSGLEAYDDEGNAYTRKNINIAWGLSSIGLSGSTQFTLPQDVPLKFRIQMDGISPNASKFSLLRFSLHYGGGNMNPMELRWGSYATIRNLEWSK